MSQFNVTIKGLDEFKRALSRNPRVVKRELSDFFVDVMRIYNKGVIRQPWRVGGSGGGAPVDTGHLRDSHQREISTWQAKIFVNPQRVKYAYYVHEGTRGMTARPWLDYIFDKSMAEVKRREKKLLEIITNNLAK